MMNNLTIKIIPGYKEGFDPFKIYKKSNLITNAMRCADNSFYGNKVDITLLSKIQKLKLTPSESRLLSYLIFLSKVKYTDTISYNYIRLSQCTLCKKLGFKSRDTIRRATKKLDGLKLINTTSELNQGLVLGKYRNTTIWYKINYEQIKGIFGIWDNIEIQLMRYALSTTRKQNVKQAANKEKSIVTTATKIKEKMLQSIVRKRFQKHGWISYPEQYKQLKSISASNKSKNKIRFYFYQNPRDKNKNFMKIKESSLQLFSFKSCRSQKWKSMYKTNSSSKAAFSKHALCRNNTHQKPYFQNSNSFKQARSINEIISAFGINI